jgi:hypothetical protein
MPAAAEWVTSGPAATNLPDNSPTAKVTPGNVRPLVWLAAVRDHPQRPAAPQCWVLTALALRLDWAAGSGYVSTERLRSDAGITERTVRRATTWARRHGLLVMTRRGHRMGDGRKVASEWALALPSQPVTADTLSESQPDTTDRLRAPQPGTALVLHSKSQPDTRVRLTDLNRTITPSQPDSRTPPSRPVNIKTCPDYSRPVFPPSAARASLGGPGGRRTALASASMANLAAPVTALSAGSWPTGARSERRGLFRPCPCPLRGVPVPLPWPATARAGQDCARCQVERSGRAMGARSPRGLA